MSKTRFAGIVISTATLALVFSGCGVKDSVDRNGDTTREESIEQQEDIMEMVKRGEITKEEADEMTSKLMNDIETKEEEMIRTQDNISQFDGLPSWAISAGMIEPEGLVFIPEDSSITEAGGDYTNSFVAMYGGDAIDVLGKARTLATNLGIIISMDTADLFMADGTVGEYGVSLVVADNGKGVQLTYSGYEMP